MSLKLNIINNFGCWGEIEKWGEGPHWSGVGELRTYVA